MHVDSYYEMDESRENDITLIIREQIDPQSTILDYSGTQAIADSPHSLMNYLNERGETYCACVESLVFLGDEQEEN